MRSYPHAQLRLKTLLARTAELGARPEIFPGFKKSAPERVAILRRRKRTRKARIARRRFFQRRLNADDFVALLHDERVVYLAPATRIDHRHADSDVAIARLPLARHITPIVGDRYVGRSR